MQLAEQLHAAGIPVFPCRQDKAPAVPRGVDWRMVAAQPPQASQWPSGLVGVPVPHGLVIIDLDTYKGITRQSAEMALGCTLPWDQALIQRTQHGGEHYAFRAPAWPVRQGSDIDIVGLDTRIGGKGYICAGDGYSPVGFGVFAFAHPGALPVLPEGTRAALERVEKAPREDVALPEGDRDIETIKAALAHCDPDCSRSAWVKIGMALRHQFHDDQDIGHALFDQWSSGEIGQKDAPASYSPEDCEHQWNSFKAEGGTTIGSLYFEALKGGWLPPRHIDVGAAFGGTVAAPDIYQAMMTKITERGCDPTATADLAAEVGALVCNVMQRAVLVATLRRELKDAGLLDKGVKDILDRLQQDPDAPRASDRLPRAAAGQLVPFGTPLHPSVWAPFHTKGKDQKPRGTPENFKIMLASYGVSVAFNDMAKTLIIKVPGVNDTGVLKDEAAISKIEGLANLNDFPKGDVSAQIVLAAHENTIYPPKEYVESMHWDGRDHVGALFSALSLAPGEDPGVCCELFRRWFRGAAAMAVCSITCFEQVLVLVDPKGGAGKTRFFRTLCPPELRKDSLTLDTTNKDSVKEAISYWLVELGELDGTFSKSEAAHLKSFLSRAEDEIRLPYGRVSLKYPRRTAFFSSVNSVDFLVDDSENRRYWPIGVSSINYEHPVDVRQVWAQALQEHRNGYPHFLSKLEQDVMLKPKNEAHRATSPVSDMLSERILGNTCTPVHMTVTNILKVCGMQFPTKRDTNEAANWLRRNGIAEVKRCGVRGFMVPNLAVSAAAFEEKKV